nr:hypothetical protein [Tanacetum cinerariifolium]
MDIKSAFLYGTIEEEVYVCQPSGFEDPDYPDKVYKVVKALNGLHQAVRAWQKGDILFVQIYGDDIIFVKQKKDGIFINQDKYVAEILRKFRLTKGKSASTPIYTKKPLLKDLDGEDVDVHTYMSMIGSLMYLTLSRPDIMFAVYTCAHFQVTLKASHLHAVMRVFRYLKGKPHLGLWYPKDSPFNLVAYSDSNYDGASLDRKSTTGGCQFLGCRLISWQCKKQTVVSTSSTEAEYVVAASCCAQVLWIQNQLLDYRAWYETLANYLLENGFQRGKIDKTLFIKRQKGDILFVQIYVDDVIFGSTNKDLCKDFEKLMKDKFQMSLMGELAFFLGLQVKQNKDGIFISHDKYVAEILRKFGLTDGKSASTPIDTEKPLLKDPDGEDVDVHTYRLMIGSLMYLTSSRPDIMFAVNDVMRLQALVDKKKVVITEASIRDSLCLANVEGIECLSNEEMFAEKQVGDLSLHSIKYTSPALTQKVAEVANEVHDEGVPAAGIVAEGDVSAANDEVPTTVEEPSIPSPTSPTPPPQPSHDIPSTSQDARISMDLLQNLMDTCTTITRRVEHLEQDKVAQDLEITKLKSRVKKLERRNKASKLKRLKKEGIIANIDADEDVVLEDAKDVVADAKDGQVVDVEDNVDIQERTTESKAQMYKIDLEHANKVSSMQDEEESEPAKLREVVDVVTTAKIITEVVTAASTTITAVDVLILATTTAAAHSRRRKGVVIRDPKESATTSTIIHSEAKSKDKGKGILVEEPKPLKKQAQIKKDEKYAKELEAELNRTIDWDETEAQARKNMMIYLKNVAGFKMDYFKGMSYDDIHPIFEKHFDSNVAFLQKTKEQMYEEDSRALKRLNESQEEKVAKKQKLEEEVEELKRHLQIVPNDEDDVYTEATPLARKMLNNVRLKGEDESEVSLELLSYGVDVAMDFKEKHAKCLMLLVKELVLSSQVKAVD